ncbi:MAG: hypothetical protein Q8T09_00690 [Candidatus Melainabacteria bacterium]|nr:hypothetical protein [Candidatus Melainabacteria bacterium]
MSKKANEYAIFSARGQLVLLSVPILLIGLPISFLVSSCAPDFLLPFGLTGRQLPMIPWAVAMLSVSVAWFLDGVEMIFREIDWKSPKAVAVSIAMLVFLAVFVAGGFFSSFVPDESPMTSTKIGIGDLR